MAATTPGIDVSRWQGTIDWPQVAAAGYRFAVIRATVGDSYTDPLFAANWEGAKQAGLLVSAYHVVKPGVAVDRQLTYFMEVLGGRRPDLPLVLDVETAGGSPAAVTSHVQECLRQLTQLAGRKPIIYTARWFWDKNVLPGSEWAQYDLWVASYTEQPLLPAGWNTWRFWQYSEKGRVPGINAAVDLDGFAGSYEALQAYANPAPPQETPAAGLRARVVVPSLNVRSGPSAGYADIGDLHAGDVVNIQNLGGKDVWVEIEPGKWVALALSGKRFLELIK